jgi:hypothetical protein
MLPAHQPQVCSQLRTQRQRRQLQALRRRAGGCRCGCLSHDGPQRRVYGAGAARAGGRGPLGFAQR